jgi:ribonucleoside-diphosphate reductase alpha chain
MSRLISMSLRHGVPVQYVVEQLQKDESDDMWSFNRVVARVLKTHIPDGIAYSDKVCSSCKQSTLIYQDGCVVCTSCAHSKCN